MKNPVAILILLLFVFAGCKKDSGSAVIPPTYTKTTIPYKPVAGVNLNLLSLDVYNYGDVTQSKPVVVYVHGGGWSIGDKTNKLENKLSLFNSLGYIFISLNYCLSLDPPELNNPNRIKGVIVSQVNGSGYNHDGINETIGETTITEPLKNFIKQCFQ